MNYPKNRKEYLDSLSKAIVHIIYRNGSIEDIHSDPNKNLNDSDMKKLNKEIHNRLYTVLLAMYADEPYSDIYNAIVLGDADFSPLYFGIDWDKAEIDYDIVPNKYHKKIKRLEKQVEKQLLTKF